MILLAGSISLLTIWGCSSSMDSGGDQSGGGTTLADAQAVGIDNCLTCHNPATTVVQEWLDSRHGNRRAGGDPDPSVVLATDYCRYCHRIEDTGNIDYSYLGQFLLPNPNWIEANADAPFIGCENCHGGGQFHYGIPAGIPFPEPSTQQCAKCHYLNDALVNQQALADPLAAIPPHDLEPGGENLRRNISDSHVDDPATEIIEGYVVKNEGTGGCNSCHAAHEFDLTHNNEWAESPHSGYIKVIKDAAEAAGAVDAATLLANVTAAGVVDTPWDHGWLGLGDGECQRCHTATGAMNFLNGPLNYYTVMAPFVAYEEFLEGDGPEAPAATNPNDFSYLADGQQELLFCWACHTDSAGTMRNPGSVTLQDRNMDFFGPVPDVGKSNVCIGCHGGRANSDYIRNTLAADRSSSGRVHHLPAAAVLFSEDTQTGYQFDLDNDGDAAEHYVNPAILHTVIGRNLDSPETGIGPCAPCHMEPGADHHFAVVEKDATTGDITAINNQALCAGCHGGDDAYRIAALQTLSDQYQDVLRYFIDVVTASNGQTNYASVIAGVPVNFDDATFLRSRPDDVSGQNDYGAHQNYEFVRSDDGFWGYAHNATYVRRLIFDSLDWLDTGALDGTITIPLTYPGAIVWLGGNPATGVVATRPGPYLNFF